MMLTIDVILEEDESHTDAVVHLTLKDRGFKGEGRARRNPVDPNIPLVGEELALARALADLSHHLITEAADNLEASIHEPVDLEE